MSYIKYQGFKVSDIVRTILHPLNKIIQLAVPKCLLPTYLSSFAAISSFIYLLSSYFACVGPSLDLILGHCYCALTGLRTFNVFFLHSLEFLERFPGNSNKQTHLWTTTLKLSTPFIWILITPYNGTNSFNGRHHMPVIYELSCSSKNSCLLINSHC